MCECVHLRLHMCTHMCMHRYTPFAYACSYACAGASPRGRWLHRRSDEAAYCRHPHVCAARASRARLHVHAHACACVRACVHACVRVSDLESWADWHRHGRSACVYAHVNTHVSTRVHTSRYMSPRSWACDDDLHPNISHDLRLMTQTCQHMFAHIRRRSAWPPYLCADMRIASPMHFNLRYATKLMGHCLGCGSPSSYTISKRSAVHGVAVRNGQK